MGATMAEYRIKEAVARQGYTLHRLAEETGLAEARLRAIANNRVDNVTIKTLETIAAQLGVPLSAIFTEQSLGEVPRMPERRPVD